MLIISKNTSSQGYKNVCRIISRTTKVEPENLYCINGELNKLPLFKVDFKPAYEELLDYKLDSRQQLSLIRLDAYVNGIVRKVDLGVLKKTKGLVDISYFSFHGNHRMMFSILREQNQKLSKHGLTLVLSTYPGIDGSSADGNDDDINHFKLGIVFNTSPKFKSILDTYKPKDSRVSEEDEYSMERKISVPNTQHLLMKERIVHRVVDKDDLDAFLRSQKTLIELYKDHEYIKMLSHVATDIAVPMEDRLEFTKELKDKASRMLSKKAKISYTEASDSLSAWAQSSSSYDSLRLQMAVSDIFDCAIPEYLIKKIDKASEQINSKLEPTSAHYKIAEATYNLTQDLLKQSGIKKLLVYRGFLDSTTTDTYASQFVSVDTNPISSFSNAFRVAYEFADDGTDMFKGRKKPHLPKVIGGWIPADRVFSTPMSGFGCNNELEFVVLGGNYAMHQDPVCLLRTREVLDGVLGIKFTISPDKIRLYTQEDEDLIRTLIDNSLAKANLKLPPDSRLEEWLKIINGAYTEQEIESLSSPITVRVDEDINNADWVKKSWDLPTYKSEDFYKHLAKAKMSLEEFKQLPVYKHAVKQGLIVED